MIYKWNLSVKTHHPFFTQSGHSRSQVKESSEMGETSRKRKHAVTDKYDMASKRPCNEDKEFPNDLQDESRQDWSDKFHNSYQTNQYNNYFPHCLVELMYLLDFSVLCTLRMFTYENKYSSLSLMFGDSVIDKFNNIVICSKMNSIYVKIENVNKCYIDDYISYDRLFTKEKQKFSINNYFKSFFQHLMSKLDNSFNHTEYFIIYTNAGLNLTDEKKLKQGRSRNFYPFQFDIINIEECHIFKDFLSTHDDMKGCVIYQFLQNKTTRKELLKRLVCSSAMQQVIKERKLSQEEIKEQFLNKLLFVVNQPNREELNSILKNEIENIQGDYTALQEKLLRDLICTGKRKKLGPLINCIHVTIYHFNLLMSFLHDMYLHKNWFSINSERKIQNISNDITIHYKNKIIYFKAHTTDGNISFSQLFSSRKQEEINMFNKYFTFFIDKLKNEIKFFIIYTDANLDLTEKNYLKQGCSTNCYPLKVDNTDIKKKKYKILRDCSCINKKGLYQFAQEEKTRKKLLSLLTLPPSLQKEKEEGRLSYENEKEKKEEFLDKLIFAVNQPNRKELTSTIKNNIENNKKLKNVPYNYEELYEIALRWLESHEFGLITKEIMEKLIEDIKNKRFSYPKIENKNINEEIKFVQSVIGRKGTPAFDDFLDFLIKEKGLEILKRKGINLTSMSSILGRAGNNAPKSFKDLYDLWFDAEGNNTQYLKTLEREGINLSNMSSILNRAGANSAIAFKDLYDLWFDEEGNKTQYLKTLETQDMNLANMSSILSGSRAKAPKAFKDLYDLWFDIKGKKTQYLKTLEKEEINLPNMSSILSGAGANAAKAFKDLYDLWFDEEGNKTQYLKTLGEEDINLPNVSSILSGAGVNAAKAFKDLYDLWFDEKGNKTQYLKTIEEGGINLPNISSILHGVGAKAAKAFKDLYDLWFDEAGNKTDCLKTLETNGINLPNMSSILHGVGAKAAKAFKELYDLWFDEEGNKTQYFKTVQEKGISLPNMSNILHGAGTNAPKAFKDLYDLWFDEEGNKTHYLKTLEEKGIKLPHMSSILGGAGAKAAKAFKDLYDLWFDKEGNITQYLKTLEEKGINLSNMSSILGGAGTNSAKSFKDLYDLWFDERGNKTQYLKTLEEEGVNISNMSSILGGAGTNPAKAFKDLYDLWFDVYGNKTMYLIILEKEGVNLAHMSSILNGTGAKAHKAFKSLYNLWFDEEGNKTQCLKTLEEKEIDLSHMASILHGAGAKAPKAFKELCNTFLDEQGNKKRYLEHFIKKKDGEKTFKLSNLSSILSKAGAKAKDAFVNLHDVCFNDEGKRTALLEDFYNAGFKPSNLSSILCGTGVCASSILKRLHSVCFNKKREKTNVLNDFYRAGFRMGNLCSMLSGAADDLENFHDFCFKGETKRYLNCFLNEKEGFRLSNLSKILHGAGANIYSALTDFHNICFDEKGNKTELLCNFHKAGFRRGDLSNILSMAGNNATFILSNFHNLCFNENNYLDHFLAEEKLFTPKDLSKILHGVGINICPIFEDLHDICFDKAGNKTKYLNNLIKNDQHQNMVIDTLREKVRKAPSFLNDMSLQQQDISRQLLQK